MMKTLTWLKGIFSLQTGPRIVGLDIIRALAVLFVLFAHTSTYVTDGELQRTLLYIFGFLGVEIFFVLSGFLIGGIIIKKLVDVEKLTFSSLKNFWVRRWFRTLPNYYVVLCLYFILWAVFNKEWLLSNAYYSLYFVFLQNAFAPQPKFFNIAWSLSIEEWFYLLFPLLLLIGSLFTGKRKKSRALYVVGTLAFILIPLAMRYISFDLSDDWDYNARKMLFSRLDSIGYGLLGAYLFVKAKDHLLKFRFLYLALGLVVLVANIIYYNDVYIVSYLNSVYLSTIFFSAVSFGILLCLPYFYSIKDSGSFLKKAAVYVSLISYSIYLYHGLVIRFMNKAPILKSHVPGNLKFVLVWILTILVSALVYKFFEVPTTKLRDKFS